MSSSVYAEHLQVLDTLCRNGLITLWAKKSMRGQILSMKTHDEREAYLKKIIKGAGRKHMHPVEVNSCQMQSTTSQRSIGTGARKSCARASTSAMSAGDMEGTPRQRTRITSSPSRTTQSSPTR